jgi:hypothetical protein
MARPPQAQRVAPSADRRIITWLGGEIARITLLILHSTSPHLLINCDLRRTNRALPNSFTAFASPGLLGFDDTVMIGLDR